MNSREAEHLAEKAQRMGYRAEARPVRGDWQYGEYVVTVRDTDGGTSTFTSPFAYYLFQNKMSAAVRSLKTLRLALRTKTKGA